MSQETIQFMLTKILQFETFENRIIDLEAKNVELESNLKIVQNQLEILTQNNKKNLYVESDAKAGTNFTENPLENAEILSNLDDQDVFDHQNSSSTEMDSILSGSQPDVKIENQNSDFVIEGIKSEGCEWDSTSTMIDQNVEIFPASSSSLIPPFSIDKEIKICKSNQIETTQDGLRSSVSESRKYRCKICSKFFKSRTTFDDHLKVDSKCRDKTWQCSTCLKTFTRLTYLKIHKRTHTGENPYSCSVCPKKFSKKFSLIVHSRIHTGDKPHICQFCPKKFTSSSNLIKHIRTHTGEKPYICSFCPNKFTQRSHLTFHTRTVHTGESSKILQV